MTVSTTSVLGNGPGHVVYTMQPSPREARVDRDVEEPEKLKTEKCKRRRKVVGLEDRRGWQHGADQGVGLAGGEAGEGLLYSFLTPGCLCWLCWGCRSSVRRHGCLAVQRTTGLCWRTATSQLSPSPPPFPKDQVITSK